jgi:hypothetical protein
MGFDLSQQLKVVALMMLERYYLLMVGQVLEEVVLEQMYCFLQGQ